MDHIELNKPKEDSSDSESEIENQHLQHQVQVQQIPDDSMYLTENPIPYGMVPVEYHTQTESVQLSNPITTVPMQRKRKSNNYSMVDYEMTSGATGVTTTTVLMQDKRRKHPKFLNLTRDESFFAVQHIPILYAKIKKSDGKYKDPRGRCIICARNCPVRCKTCNFWICIDRSDGSSNCWSQIHDINFYSPMAISPEGIPIPRDDLGKEGSVVTATPVPVPSQYPESVSLPHPAMPLPIQSMPHSLDSASMIPPSPYSLVAGPESQIISESKY